MRLFIGLNFSSRFRAALTELSQNLAAQAVFCRPCREENFHLTLAFLGELPDSCAAAAAVAAVNGPAFTLVTDRLGCFRGREGDLYWLGLKPNPELTALRRSLLAGLKVQGLSWDDKQPFRPHLTLLRQAVFPPGFDSAAAGLQPPPLHERCFRVSLLLSERSAGRLQYRELAGKDLD